MTREEAIEILEKYKTESEEDYYVKRAEALDMAIKSLEQEPCEDAVNRKEIQKKINRLWNSGGDKDYCMETLRDFVIEAPSVTPTQKWIPVSERLPEEKGFYLVSVKNEHNRRYSKSCWFYGNGNWFARQEVIAWMPLPEPYKVESEDKE